MAPEGESLINANPPAASNDQALSAANIGNPCFKG